MSRRPPKRTGQGPEQLEFSFESPKAQSKGLRLIRGGGQSKKEQLDSRDSVMRVLLEAGVDLLLRRISAERAEEIESRVDRVLTLFDRPGDGENRALLRTELDDLERLMTETRALRAPRRRSV